MKKFFASFCLILALTSIPISKASAQSVSASTIGTNFAQNALTTAPTYLTLFTAAQVLKAIKGISIWNGSTKTVNVYVGPNSTLMLQVPPGGSTTVGPSVPFFYPLVASQNNQIQIATSDGAITSGLFFATIFYN